MGNLYNELKRRNVIKSSLAYLVVAWVLLQVFSILLPMVEAPSWVLKTATLLMAIGFPIWILFSWIYEVTPEGIKKTAQVSTDNSISAKTNKRLTILILIGLVTAILVAVFLGPNISFRDTYKKDVISANSIAVLPFDDMSSEGDTEWFCDGVTEDILTNLSKLKELKVISRTSTEKFRNSGKTIPEIANELGVAYILEGSVRKHNNNVLITAQLIKANDEHLWADKYSEPLDDVFKIQSIVSAKIVEQLKITITPEEKTKIETAPTANVEAYQYVLQGRNFLAKGGNHNTKIAIELFQKAIDLDPNYADALADMAYAYLPSTVRQQEYNIELAEELANKAYAINPNSSRVLSVMGIFHVMNRNMEKAKEFFEKALEISPSDSRAHQNIGLYYLSNDNPKQGFYHIDKAVELDPFSIELNALKMNLLIDNNQLDKAEQFVENNKALPSGRAKYMANMKIIEKNARNISEEKKDRLEGMKVFEEAVIKYPNHPILMRFYAKEYDEVLNDDENFVKYARIAYRLDSTHLWPASAYYNALVESKRFEEANELYNDKIFNDLLNPTRKIQRLFYSYYHQENYEKSEELVNDPLIPKNYWGKLLNAAQLGDTIRVYEYLKNRRYSDSNRAFAFAILEERDSLYYYLEKGEVDAGYINARREVDPYRKEVRYKAFLKKNYLPITEWNE